ncbi:RagB/SusD family nutrient uptake outer membrane protein [Fulvivirgaceae bacterium BMA12]|uniref:RagB/SusD family nutrient uptake outer membrane protein n=1 Tax=Agaribacillus aureus TaxID=3051825 RepID=A0ABT8L4I1_9BACT|nr:RagB/SusD family nutrient uptake outer membrane protein [Fulvivirgaceae bacterium BMA12]
MKRLIKILAITCPALFINQSCDEFLDVVPDDSPTLDIAFENRSTALTFLATIYSYLPDYQSIVNPALFGGDELWVNEIVQQSVFNGFPALEIAQGQQSEGNTRLSYTTGGDGTSNLYIALRDCNILLENIDSPFDMSEREKKQWTAEAKVLKAYYHFWLMRMYGPIPIIRENLPVDVEGSVAKREREPVDVVVDYIVGLIDESIEDLSPFDLGGSELGRINQPIAAAIKAKILMTAASPLFNGNTDYPSFFDSENRELINSTFVPEKWIKAADACKEAINLAEAAGHTLYTFPSNSIGPNTISDRTKRKLSIRGSVTEINDNTEVIWKATGRQNFLQSRYMAKMNDPLGIITQFAHTSIQSYYSPTLRIAEMFYTENGVPISEDKDFDYANRFNLRDFDIGSTLNINPGHTTAQLHFQREPRFYASLGFDGAVWFGHSRFDENNTWNCNMKGGQAGGFTGDASDNTWSVTGYLPKKMVHYQSAHPEAGASFNQQQYPWPIIRLADLYLLCAEALNEVSGPSGEVYGWMNKVRSRAGIPDVEEAWTNFSTNPARISNKDELRKIIHRERMIELVFEGHRFWDLRRWKRSVEFMNNKRIRGWTINSGSTAGFYNVRTIFQQSFDTKDYLWPIPLDNILSNPKLIQNPGW